jgi:hypothetical protein
VSAFLSFQEPVTGFLDAQAIWSWGEKGSKSTISNFFRATSSDLKNATGVFTGP